MNIRGTDPAAIAPVTDLFVCTAPARDDSASAFQKALQPPPTPKAPTPAQETKPAAPAPPPATTNEQKQPKTQQSSEAQPVTRDDHEDAHNEAAEAPVADEAAPTDANPPAEAEEESDTAAESLAVAATQVPAPVVEQKPKVTPEAKEVAATEATDEEGNFFEAPEALGPSDVIVAAQQADASSNDVPALPVETAVDPTQAVAIDAAAASGELVVEEVASQESATEVDPTKVVTEVAAEAIAVETTSPTQNGAKTVANGKKGSAEAAGASADRKQSDGMTSDAAAEQTTTQANAEIAPGSQMTNQDEGKEGKSKDSNKSNEFAAQLPAVPQPSDVAPAPTMTNESANSNTPTNSSPTDTVSAANGNREAAAAHMTQPAAVSALVNRLPTHALVRNVSTTTQETASPLHVDAARFLQRVSKAFESARDRGGEIRIRLSPPELGALRVEVSMQEQGMSARLEVESPEARAVLLENLPALRERLAEQGVRLERFDVELSQRDSQQQGGNLNDQPRDRQTHAENRSNKESVQRQPVPTNSTTITVQPTGWQDRQLNVIV